MNPDDVLADVETDKATVDFTFQDEGYLAKVLVAEGASDIPVGQVKRFEINNSSSLQLLLIAKMMLLSLLILLLMISWVKELLLKQFKLKLVKDHHLLHHQDHQVLVIFHYPITIQATSTGGRIFASPLAKKVASEKGVDLSHITGSGPNGRILRQDVEEQGHKAQQAQQQATVARTEQKEEKKEEKKAAPKPQVVQASNPYVDEPVSNMRDVIARRLLESKTTIPHYYLESEITMDKITK